MRFDSLKARFRIALIALAILPLLSVGLALTARTYTTQRNQVLQLQNEIVRGIADEVTNFVDARINELRIGAQVGSIQTIPVADQRSLLNEMMSYQPAFDGLSLIDRSGQEVTRVSRLSVVTDNDLTDRSQADEFTFPISNGSTYIGATQVDEATAQLTSTIGIPLTDPRSGEITHILTAEVRLSFLGTLLSNIRGSTTAYIVSDTGQVIAHPNSSIVLSETHYELPEDTGIHTGLSGESSVIAYTSLNASNEEFYVVAEEPTSIAFNLLQITLVVLGVAMVANLIIALLLATLGARFIVKPLQDLAAVAEKIRNGDLKQRAEVKGSDEIGVLALTFNEMTAQLSQLIGTLEQRVEERTRDLNIAAQVSQQVTSVLDLKVLLPYLANLTQTGFELVHVSVFVHDKDSNTLRLEAGSGKVGEEMLAAGKQFAMEDKGLVPLAARTAEAQINNDVKASPDHFVNPLLPDTRSELTIPMRVGTQLIGVLDLQSDETDHFTDENVSVLTALAEQIAVAIQNAQLYARQHELIDGLRAADQIKSQFLASMSHELRTPLNSILTFSDLMAMGTFGNVTEEQTDYLQKILFSGRHLLALINDVLDISKMESGMMKLFIEEDFDIEKEVAQATASVEKLIEDRDVELILDVDGDFPLIAVDKRRIRQILLNILSNAAKFTEEGTITLSVKKKQDNVLFAIIDTGPGIPEDQQELIFEPFVQTETGIKHAGGTGLGLPISKRLVEAHGGRLWLESKPGEGAAFYFTIPIKPTVEVGEVTMEVAL